MGRKVWRTMKPVIGESAGVEDVHHLMLMTLLHELAWEKGKQGCDDGLGICLRTVCLVHEDGRLSWRVREGLEQGATVGAGPAAGAQRILGAARGALKEDTRSGVEELGMTAKLLIGVPEHGIIFL